MFKVCNRGFVLTAGKAFDNRALSIEARFRSSLPILIVVIIAGLSTEVGGAADLLGLYVGGAAGPSQLRVDLNSFSCSSGYASLFPCSGPSNSFSTHSTGWEAIAGVRPIPFLGAEADYIDFGSSGNTVVQAPTGGGVGISHPTAPALFAVGYAPVPLSYLDIFGKVGVAELKSDISFSGVVGCGTNFRGPGICDPYGAFQSSVKRSNLRPAYGAGLQLKWGGFGGRMEYERIVAGTGDPSMFAFGLSWEF